MMLRNFVFCLLSMVLLSTGCTTGKMHDLGNEWLPLKEIHEKTLTFMDDDWIETVGEYAYVANLDEFLKIYPEDSVVFRALMTHEREHSVRQGTGLNLAYWLVMYNLNPSYAWEEEQAGWYVQIKYLMNAGVAVNIDNTVKVLVQYSNWFGQVVSEEEAMSACYVVFFYHPISYRPKTPRIVHPITVPPTR